MESRRIGYVLLLWKVRVKDWMDIYIYIHIHILNSTYLSQLHTYIHTIIELQYSTNIEYKVSRDPMKQSLLFIAIAIAIAVQKMKMKISQSARSFYETNRTSTTTDAMQSPYEYVVVKLSCTAINQRESTSIDSGRKRQEGQTPIFRIRYLPLCTVTPLCRQCSWLSVGRGLLGRLDRIALVVCAYWCRLNGFGIYGHGKGSTGPRFWGNVM